MNKLLFGTVFFCLSVLSLSSCRQEDEIDRSNESGDLVAVTIPIEGVIVESTDSPLTRTGSVEPQTIIEDLEDGFVLETSLMPVSAGLTRASSTTGLANDVQILAIAYKESGELYKYQYFTPGSPIIHLPKGERFKLVFYSYNSTAKPDISKDITGSVSPVTNGALFSKNASLNDKSESHENNVMWGRIDLTPVITSGVSLSGVTFTHLFSRLDWQLRSVVGDITDCSGSVRNTYRNGSIKLGNLVNVPGGSNGSDTWVGVGNADYAAPVGFDGMGSTDKTSSKTVFCPNVGHNISLCLDNITVGGKNFMNKSYTFSTKLKRGVDYRAVSTIKRRMTVTFSVAAGGTITLEGAQTATAYGDRFESTALANTGYIFDGWYRIEDLDRVKLTGVTANEEVKGRKLVVFVNAATEGRVYEATFRQDVPNIEWARANLMYENGQYVFKNVKPGAPFNAGAFFMPRREKPGDGVAVEMTLHDEGEWNWDPCAKVTADGGRWRLPTRMEIRRTRGWWAPPWNGSGYPYCGMLDRTSSEGTLLWNFGAGGLFQLTVTMGPWTSKARWRKKQAWWPTSNYATYINLACTEDATGTPNGSQIMRSASPNNNEVTATDYGWTNQFQTNMPSTVRCVRDKNI